MTNSEELSNFQYEIKDANENYIEEEGGFTHFPHEGVEFAKPLTVAEKAIVAQRLKQNGINDFSIDRDFFIVSILDFNSETYEQREQSFHEKQASIATAFRGEGEKVGANRVKNVRRTVRKTKYVGGRNAGDEQSQTREYDKRDFFEALRQGGLTAAQEQVVSCLSLPNSMPTVVLVPRI